MTALSKSHDTRLDEAWKESTLAMGALTIMVVFAILVFATAP
jgi:hypothetical protein